MLVLFMTLSRKYFDCYSFEMLFGCLVLVQGSYLQDFRGEILIRGCQTSPPFMEVFIKKYTMSNRNQIKYFKFYIRYNVCHSGFYSNTGFSNIRTIYICFIWSKVKNTEGVWQGCLKCYFKNLIFTVWRLLIISITNKGFYLLKLYSICWMVMESYVCARIQAGAHWYSFKV